MLAKVYSTSVYGIDAYPVEIEIDVANGLPSVVVVGLPDTAVKESKERVKSAIQNCGYKHPIKRITVNLAPADIKKEGPGFDLPIAMGILAASEQLNQEKIKNFYICGELALDGQIRPVKGVLSMAIHARNSGKKGFIVPSANVAEAAVVDGIDVYPAEHLSEVISFINDGDKIAPLKIDRDELFAYTYESHVDFSDVHGQPYTKRALEIAAAGGHNVIMIWPPGSGKTMLARRIPTILPPMTSEESLETTKIHSIMGLLGEKKSLITMRPFRSPHHTISDSGLIGGGTFPKPGEVSLAHNGVLFLDELAEFNRHVLEVMRQPLEDGEVTISRAAGSVNFPARFMLIAATNPCPCGHANDPKKECRCSSNQIEKYMAKISGPLLDRIDIHLEVAPVEYRDLLGKQQEETSASIRERVVHARRLQNARFKGKKIFCNAQMASAAIRQHCTISQESEQLLKKAMEHLGLSARAYHRILKVARTIADLADSHSIETPHILEAIQYRSLDRSYFR
ncbi:MAG: YifB family Mg chelatase-like AAA ATPase [Candidatus Auribacterota bacterium]|jgi:magnesium chelatase family protein|nr:YifB family Mg chelatase-like AAA ATPase [Candidatus Auribacterota bacterium]